MKLKRKARNALTTERQMADCQVMSSQDDGVLKTEMRQMHLHVLDDMLSQRWQSFSHPSAGMMLSSQQ